MNTDLDDHFAAMTAGIEARMADAEARLARTRAEYAERIVPTGEIGRREGAMHPASIMAWIAVARVADVPHVPAELAASIPIDDVWAAMDSDGERVSPAGRAELVRAVAAVSAPGVMWRSDLCAPMDVKHAMAHGRALPAELPLMLDDPRMMDLHDGVPTLDVVVRPRVAPFVHLEWPAEFRVFVGGGAKGIAASWYYPQTGVFQPTAALERAMDQSIAHAERLVRTRDALGLVPWFPGRGEPDAGIGATLDFMLTAEGETLLIDAGPGADFGAHPCCFRDAGPIRGRRWHLAPGVEAR